MPPQQQRIPLTSAPSARVNPPLRRPHSRNVHRYLPGSSSSSPSPGCSPASPHSRLPHGMPSAMLQQYEPAPPPLTSSHPASCAVCRRPLVTKAGLSRRPGATPAHDENALPSHAMASSVHEPHHLAQLAALPHFQPLHPHQPPAGAAAADDNSEGDYIDSDGEYDGDGDYDDGFATEDDDFDDDDTDNGLGFGAATAAGPFGMDTGYDPDDEDTHAPPASPRPPFVRSQPIAIPTRSVHARVRGPHTAPAWVGGGAPDHEHDSRMGVVCAKCGPPVPLVPSLNTDAIVPGSPGPTAADRRKELYYDENVIF